MIIIDIREEHELKDQKMKSDEISIINIPMRNIQFNIDYINNLSKKDKVYLVCKSSYRSKLIKNKYFSNNDNIHFDKIDNIDNIEIIKGKNKLKLGMQQYMQIMFLIILIAGTFINLFFGKFYFFIFNTLIILMIVYQLSTKSCVLGKILMKFG